MFAVLSILSELFSSLADALYQSRLQWFQMQIITMLEGFIGF